MCSSNAESTSCEVQDDERGMLLTMKHFIVVPEKAQQKYF